MICSGPWFNLRGTIQISPLSITHQVGKGGSKGADRPRRGGETGGRPKGLLARPRERCQARLRSLGGGFAGEHVKLVTSKSLRDHQFIWST